MQELDEYARSHGRSVTELAIAWLLSRPTVAVSLVGARDARQLETCLRGARWTLAATHVTHVDDIIKACGLVEQVRSRPDVYFEQ